MCKADYCLSSNFQVSQWSRPEPGGLLPPSALTPVALLSSFYKTVLTYSLCSFRAAFDLLMHFSLNITVQRWARKATIHILRQGKCCQQTILITHLSFSRYPGNKWSNLFGYSLNYTRCYSAHADPIPSKFLERKTKERTLKSEKLFLVSTLPPTHSVSLGRT